MAPNSEHYNARQKSDLKGLEKLNAEETEAKLEILLIDTVAGPGLECISPAYIIIQSVHITVTNAKNREHTTRVNAMFD